MRVIGTAGHVDHGKSTLIAALTGTHPDRLKEEQAREMTIELGFGWLTLPNGEEVGIIDVPGHRDFIGNMLAGIGGIDAALLVIAADEGVMPQTREHLAILDLLQIPNGLVVLTKTDLAEDPEWQSLVQADIREALRGTTLQNAPILPVSARTGAGLPNLLQALAAALQNTPPRPNLSRPRLPIDRVFSMPGFGTVVTGTLSDGALRVGDEVEILPAGKKARVRGLQTHKRKEETAQPGSRTAVNLTGLAVEDLRRGDLLTLPGQYSPSRRLDVRLRLLPDLSAPLKHGAQVKVFWGAAESLATLRLLEVEAQPAGQPGAETWAQLELHEPLAVTRADRLILRRPSPSETLGAAWVVNPHPAKRHRRFDAPTLAALQARMQGDPAEVLFLAASSLGVVSLREAATKANLPAEAALPALKTLLDAGSVLSLESAPPHLDALIVTQASWATLQETVHSILQSYHAQYPLRRGMPREELKSRLKLSTRVFQMALKRLALQENAAALALPGYEVRFTPAQRARADALLKKFAASPAAPPSPKECQAEAGEDLYAALLEQGELYPVSLDVVFLRKDYEKMTQTIRQMLAAQGRITAAEVRDALGTTRKYALALLEHLDTLGVTLREGDFRRLK